MWCSCLNVYMLNLMHFCLVVQSLYIQMFTSDFYLQLILMKSLTCQLYLQHGQVCVPKILAGPLHVFWWEGSGEVIARVAPAFSVMVWVGFPPCWLTVPASIGTFGFAQTGP